jgi:hypothetical protein
MGDYEVMVPFQALQALSCSIYVVCPGQNIGDTCPNAIHDFEGKLQYDYLPPLQAAVGIVQRGCGLPYLKQYSIRTRAD